MCANQCYARREDNLIMFQGLGAWIGFLEEESCSGYVLKDVWKWLGGQD